MFTLYLTWDRDGLAQSQQSSNKQMKASIALLERTNMPNVTTVKTTFILVKKNL